MDSRAPNCSSFPLLRLNSLTNDFPGSFMLRVPSQNSHSIVHCSLNQTSLTPIISSKYLFKTGIAIAIGYNSPSRQQHTSTNCTITVSTMKRLTKVNANKSLNTEEQQ